MEVILSLCKKRKITMFEKIPLAEVDNTGWLKLRKIGIGDVNPYSSAMKVFRNKTSEEVEEQDNEAIRFLYSVVYL